MFLLFFFYATTVPDTPSDGRGKDTVQRMLDIGKGTTRTFKKLGEMRWARAGHGMVGLMVRDAFFEICIGMDLVFFIGESL